MEGEGWATERLDGSLSKGPSQSKHVTLGARNKANICPTHIQYFSSTYTHTHMIPLTPHPPPRLHSPGTTAHPSSHCPAVSLCLWTIPTCRVRGPNGPLLFSSRLNINITTIQRLQRISSYNRDTQIKVPRQQWVHESI